MENISTTQNTYHFAGFRKRALSSVIDGIANGTGIGAIINIVMYYLHGNTLGYLVFGFQIVDIKTGQQASRGKLFLRWFIKTLLSLLLILIIWFLAGYIFRVLNSNIYTESPGVEIVGSGNTGLIGAIKGVIHWLLGLSILYIKLGTLFAILGIASPTAITVPFSKTKSGIHDMIVGTYAIKKQ